MKRRIALFTVAALLLLCFAGCQEAPVAPTEPAVEEYSFTYKGTEVTLNALAGPIVTALGEPFTYSETTSCAFDGLDKTYGYGSFYVQTYPKDGQDYIYGFWFVDDLVANAEGIALNSPQRDVDNIYGTEGFNGSNAYVMTKGNGKLTIIVTDGIVESIQYVLAA